jgi:hypothetical protein
LISLVYESLDDSIGLSGVLGAHAEVLFHHPRAKFLGIPQQCPALGTDTGHLMERLRMIFPRTAVVAGVAALGLVACGSSSHSRAPAVAPVATSSGATTGTATGAAPPTRTGAKTTATSERATSPGNLAQFKTDIVNAQHSGKVLGTQLTSTLEHAGKMTDAEIVRRFTALSKKVGAYASSVSNFPAPPKFQSDYQLVVEGFHSVGSDLADIAKLASERAGTSQGKTEIEKLYSDLQGLSGVETTLDKAVGLPS